MKQKDEKKQCTCSMRTKLVGDGCEICNPAYALEMYQDTLVDLEVEAEQLREVITKLKLQLIESEATA